MTEPEPEDHIQGELTASLTATRFTELPHNQLLQQYLAGEVIDEELGEGGVLAALATSVVELQEIVVKMVRRFGPLLGENEGPASTD